jgi:CRISPR-associated protein Cas2
MKYLITYDISEDRKRNKVIKLLNEYGRRVQFSCFEIEIHPKKLPHLVSKLQELIDNETDRLFVFPISEYATPFIKKLGKTESDDNSSIVL